MTGTAVSVNSGGRVDITRGNITSSSTGVLTGGSASRAYLIPSFEPNGGGRFQGPTFTDNSRGIVAVGGSEIRTGTASVSSPGFGLTTITTSATQAMSAYSGAAIYAGTGAPGSGNYQRNRVFLNGGADPTGNGLASGTGSRVYARCTWWNTTSRPAFRVGSASGGLFDASYYLTADPFTTANPPCTNLDPSRPAGRSAGGASVSDVAFAGEDGQTTASRGTAEAEATAFDRLAEALSAETPVQAVGILAALVAGLPETEAAAAALGEAGVIASRSGAPTSALALVVSATTSAEASLRVSAWQSLVATRRALGDATGALAAADALAAEGAEVPAETARVYLYGEAGDTARAEAALAALELVAPGSFEAELARAFLSAGDDVPLGGRPGGDAGGGTDSGKTTLGVASASRGAEALALSVAPNPAGASATVMLSVPELAEVSVVVYDLLGRSVQTPDVGTLAAGAHRVPLSVAGLAPGVYVVRAVVTTAAGAEVQSVRLTVAR